MALDTKQRRGSAGLLTMPFRPWLAEPSGSLPVASRASLLRLCSAVPPGATEPEAGDTGTVFRARVYPRTFRVTPQPRVFRARVYPRTFRAPED